jgi:hypothetical protein
MITGQDAYYPVLSKVATAYSTSYFDLRETYGYAFLPQYFGPDQYHENNAGHDLTFQKLSTILTF